MTEEDSVRFLSYAGAVERVFQVLLAGYAGTYACSGLFEISQYKWLLRNFTGLAFLANGCVWIAMRKLRDSFVYKIEFDTHEKLFVVSRPRDSFGTAKEFKVLPEDLKPVKDDPYCLYKDAKSGMKLQTVAQGSWYNSGLFLYLL